MADSTALHPTVSGSCFSPIEDIIDDFRDGRMVIMVDDENRENEGDLLMAAEKVRPEDINYMARHARGLICLTLTAERCKQLRLPLMVDATDRHHATNFTVSIEAAQGVTTGISAHDRARTVRAAVAQDARPEDLRQPGHIFPVMAQPGGVLTRAGHTETGCDLARLAGLEPAATTVEILNEDGSMARRPDLEVFARKHGLKVGTIADLVRYRLETGQFIECIAERPVTTAHGEFTLYCYEDRIRHTVHLALARGDLAAAEAPLVRVQAEDTLGDLLGIESPRRDWSVRSAMTRIAGESAGVVVVLREPETARGLPHGVNDLAGGADELHGRRTGDAVPRAYGVGAQILRHLGVRRMRLLSTPGQMHALSGFDLEVTEYVNE